MGSINETALAKTLANAAQNSFNNSTLGVSKNSASKSANTVVNRKVESVISDVESIFKSSMLVAASSLPSSVAEIFYMDSDHTTRKSNSGVSYTINFYPGGNITRPSLYPKKYPEGANIINIFDKGIHSSAKKPVSGLWHGKRTIGLLRRPALNFISTAISNAKSLSDAKGLGVRKITYNYND